MVDASGKPLAVHTTCASPEEVQLVQDTLDTSFGFDFPERLVGDKADDSDGLDADFREIGIEMIAPNERTKEARPRKDIH